MIPEWSHERRRACDAMLLRLRPGATASRIQQWLEGNDLAALVAIASKKSAPWRPSGGCGSASVSAPAVVAVPFVA
eukprot:7770376-Alexandrium_andersonii.AAC.1